MRSWIGGLIVAVLLGVSGATAQQRVLVLEGGTLIDGTGRAPIPDAVVVVEGSRIKAVGRRGQVPVPANGNVINLTGRTILPGLLDIHVHTQEWHFPMFLHYGVTTFADLDNDTAWIFAEREMLRNGRMKGPRMFVAGGKLYGPLGNPGGGPLPQNATVNRTVDEAREHMRSVEALGADYLKIDDTLTYDQLAAVIEEGKRTGLKVIGHTQNIRRAARMGTRFMEHMDTMARSLLDPDGTKFSLPWYPPRGGPVELPQVASESLINPKQFPPLIDELVKLGVYVNPTMVAEWSAATPRGQQLRNEAAQISKDPGLGFVPAKQREVWSGPLVRGRRDGYANVAAFLREYSEAGGKVVVGTDSSGGQVTIPGLSAHYEMQMLADVGIPPTKIIQGATLWNAEAIGKDKDLGSVEPGKLADFTIIEGNPLADISVTKNVRMVIKEGEVMDTKYDPKWVNPIPQPYTTLPRIRTLSPLMAPQDGPAVTLELEGTGFLPTAVVRFDNVDLPTHFVSSTKLTATVGAQLLHNVGEYPLYVVNTGTHGNVSQSKSFLVNFKN